MKNIVTKEGMLELETELNDRKTRLRESIANEIETAREQGDLSENAAYKQAMDSKEMNEIRISQLEEMIITSEVMPETSSKVKIGLGSKVKLNNLSLKQEIIYDLVGQNEADPATGKVSIQSPLGIAMLGKKKGDEFAFATPSGEHIYKVIELI